MAVVLIVGFVQNNLLVPLVCAADLLELFGFD